MLFTFIILIIVFSKIMKQRNNTISLNLVLKQHIECGSLLESMSKISWDDNIHHIDFLDVDSVVIKSSVKLLQHLGCQLRFYISDLIDSYRSDKISDAFLRFLF
jgi:hypothetical protein